MLIVLEGIALCFLLLLYSVVGIRNGAVGLVCLYEKDVQQRVVELGLISEKAIKKQLLVSSVILFVPIFTLVPYMVYGINGASDFMEGFLQMTAILLIMGFFDRLFIDCFWVNHSKAWIIPGTEDLRPYIPKKVLLRKTIGSLFGFPLLAFCMAKIMEFFL